MPQRADPSPGQTVPGARLVALFDRPWVHRWAYAITFLLGSAVALTLIICGDVLPGLARDLICMVSFIPLGFAQIVLSRSIASQRDALPLFLQVLLEGRWARFALTPAYFRFAGSACIGAGVGIGLWRLIHLFASVVASVWVAVIAGLLVALMVWVWTWFAFPGIEDN
jgi:hypothetical protein